MISKKLNYIESVGWEEWKWPKKEKRWTQTPSFWSIDFTENL